MISCKQNIQLMINKELIYCILNLVTYGTSAGNISAIILIESLLAFDVGEAANNIFNNAIICCGKFGNIAYNIQDYN